ncbi:ABC transporter substrate-binding protein [Neorhizobium sp. LjRoot104]|uniref:ABC transporter substrate-binding protein n=1 Tax=Neorhizobium sp. LjRoot104 TaxID=3342254 RepID=UPI003ECE0D94
MIDRRQLLRTIGAAALAAPLISPRRAAAQAKDLRKLNVGVGGITFAYLPMLVAKAAGYFEEEGLDLTLVNANGGANALAAALGGSVDICGLVMSDIILASAKNQKLQAFAPLMSQYASDAVISTTAAKKVGITQDMPLKERMARLKGMTLAISSRGSGIDKLWRYLIGLGGLDPDKDVTLTVVKLDQMYPALISGQIDGFNTTAPSNNRAVAEGHAVWVARPSQGEVPGLENFLYTVLGAKPEYLAANPDIPRKLVSGLAKGAKLIHSDAAKAGAVMQSEFFAQTDARLVIDTVKDQATTVASPPTLTQAQFKQNVDFMLRFGHEVEKVSFDDAINAKWMGS